jgi:hypothetical protein
MLARVGVVDFYGQTLLDTFVAPEAPVRMPVIIIVPSI